MRAYIHLFVDYIHMHEGLTIGTGAYHWERRSPAGGKGAFLERSSLCVCVRATHDFFRRDGVWLLLFAATQL